MTEIEKMFENANAYKMLCSCEFKNLFDYSINYGQDVCIHAEDEEDDIRKGCEGCELAEQNVKYYPPFTAEKQIELIKWLIRKKRLFIRKADYEVQNNNCPICVMILPLNCMDTKVWHEVIEGKYHYEILKGRIAFIDPETHEPRKGNNSGTVIVYFKKRITV